MRDKILLKTEALEKGFVYSPTERRRKRNILKGIDFSLLQGEVVGICGDNGIGKSTFFRLLAGIYSPDKGSILKRGRVVPLMELGTSFHPQLTGRQNILINGVVLGAKMRVVKSQESAILSFAGLEEVGDRLLKTYSPGWRARLALAIALHSGGDIFLIDELLSIVDPSFQEHCLIKIKELCRKGAGVILVSHNHEFLNKHCNRVCVFHEGKIVSENLPFSQQLKNNENYI